MSARRNGHFWKPEYASEDPVGFLLATLADREDLVWQDLARCAEVDPEMFFPEKGGSARAAKRVCMACEVRAECLEYALETDQRYGIWGGLSERERHRAKRESLAA